MCLEHQLACSLQERPGRDWWNEAIAYFSRNRQAVLEHLKNACIFDDHRKSFDFRDAQKFSNMHKHVWLSAIIVKGTKI